MPTNPDFVPATIEEAVDHIVQTLNPVESRFIMSQSSESAHFGGGRIMRNNWSLWEKETPIKRDAVENYGIAMADDISGLILAWVWAKVRGESFDPKEHCKRYHEHWPKYGETALSAGGYNEDGTPKP